MEGPVECLTQGRYLGLLGPVSSPSMSWWVFVTGLPLLLNCPGFVILIFIVPPQSSF